MPYVEGGSGADVASRYLAQGLRAAGCEVVLDRFHRYYQFAPRLLQRVPKPHGTEIVITNTWTGFAFKRRGTPLIAIEHLWVLDPVLDPYKTLAQRLYHRKLIRRNVRSTVRCADSLVAVSRYTAQAMARGLGIPAPQVILNAVDTEFFTPTRAPKSPARHRPVRLLFVGNLTRRKGADLLGPIMERLGPGFELQYTGGLRSGHSAFARLPQMRPLGRLDQEQVRAAYRQADLLLLPSRGEGLPLVVLESMACGTPVVAANASSLPEALAEGGGQLCRLDDPNHFATTIRALIPRLGSLSRQAREVAERRFSLPRMVAEFLSVFERLPP